MKDIIYYNGIFHSMKAQNDEFYGLLVHDGRISQTFDTKAQIDDFLLSKGGKYKPELSDLEKKHVYPCLIDGHTHMLLTIAVMAMGFNACEITKDGVEPHTISGVERRIREYVRDRKKDEIIAINNYILTAIEERRMPTKDELDDWAGGRPIVIYNIDGHSTSLSTAMLKLVGIDPKGHDGVLRGEENERTQGRIIDTVGEALTLKDLARGIARFHNYCAEYGINMVGALEGNGDSIKDSTTKLIIRLARHFDIKVRLYLQYTDIERVRPYRKYMKNPRAGGCGDWEMDGATGSHSAAFRVPFNDTGLNSPCYYTQEEVDNLVFRFDQEGYQIASHAIGECAIERLLKAFGKLETQKLHRIEHCEFHDDKAFDELKKGRYAVMMQPGYAWIDKRYLHTYTQYLPKDICDRLKFKSLYDEGICLCGSSDSPVQDMDPYLQMLGMTEFYNELESITPYEAMTTYTVNAAKALMEEDDYGTLEEGKVADFFTSEQNFFELEPNEVVGFRPYMTYYGGNPYKSKKETVSELMKMLASKPKLI